jgi:PKHD-type hydroxylase
MIHTKSNFLSQDEINQILEKHNHDLIESQIVKDDSTDCIDTSVRNNLSTFIQNEDNTLALKIAKHIHIVNKEEYKFQLIGCEPLQLSHYKPGMFYKKHLDVLSLLEDTQRKITFVIQLTPEENYEGGELVIHTSSTPNYVTKKQGSIVVFPSFLLHEVNPILSGERFSLVGWCYGLRLK